MVLVDYSLETSASLWKALPIKDRDHVTLVRPNCGSKFACPGSNFLPVLEDRNAMSTLLILSSYALLEGHVDEVLAHMAASPLRSVPLVDSVRAGLITRKSFCANGA